MGCLICNSPHGGKGKGRCGGEISIAILKPTALFRITPFLNIGLQRFLSWCRPKHIGLLLHTVCYPSPSHIPHPTSLKLLLSLKYSFPALDTYFAVQILHVGIAYQLDSYVHATLPPLYNCNIAILQSALCLTGAEP